MEKPTYEIEIGHAGYRITKRTRVNNEITYFYHYFTNWKDASDWLFTKMCPPDMAASAVMTPKGDV